MPEEKERPRPHGDPLGTVAKENSAQRQSDAPQDAAATSRPDDPTGASDRAGGKGSTSGGIPAFDEDAGEKRRKQYEGGAELVSETD
jgi:hypothetical protein